MNEVIAKDTRTQQTIDTRIYSLDIIKRALLHWSHLNPSLELGDDAEAIVSFEASSDATVPPLATLPQILLLEEARMQVEAETAGLKQEIYTAAFSLAIKDGE